MTFYLPSLSFGNNVQRDFLSMLGGMSPSQRDLTRASVLMMEQPHHPSSDEEVEEMVAGLRAFLLGLPSRGPGGITIAASTDDEYTPPEQMAGIFARVMRVIKEVYSSLDREVVVHVDEDVEIDYVL
jgi:hypothetical protein